MAKVIEAQHCNTAEDLVRVLSPFAEFWDTRGGSDLWYFRGQGDDDWELNPSAMRPESLMDRQFIGSTGLFPLNSLSEQLYAEQTLVFRFIGDCLTADLPIPEDSQWIRNGRLAEQASRKCKASGDGKAKVGGFASGEGLPENPSSRQASLCSRIGGFNWRGCERPEERGSDSLSCSREGSQAHDGDVG